MRRACRRVQPGRSSAFWPACSSKSFTTGTSSVDLTFRSSSCPVTSWSCSSSDFCRSSTTTRICSASCSGCCWRSLWCRSWRSTCTIVSSSWSAWWCVWLWASSYSSCYWLCSTWRQFAAATRASISTAFRSRPRSATHPRWRSCVCVTSLTSRASDSHQVTVHK